MDLIPFNILRSFVELLPILTILLHFILALMVLQDARELYAEGKTVAFIPPYVWILATLLGGIVPAALYWVINRSRLRRD
jgi:hypothetical protein